jgi:hypothetical protein
MSREERTEEQKKWLQEIQRNPTQTSIKNFQKLHKRIRLATDLSARNHRLGLTQTAGKIQIIDKNEFFSQNTNLLES